LNSNKSQGLKPKKEKTSKIFRTSLALTLVVFAFTMSSPSSLFQIIKPAEAATLTSVFIIPTNNIVNTKTTYDIFFKTATTGTIKFIHMTFPSGFDVSAATKLIERSGIGSGSLSVGNPTTLVYTVDNPVSVPAGTTIRLEIARIVNSDTAGNFRVSIATENTTPTIIDGPTNSFLFPIKDITGDDVSPGFMLRKTLKDDAAGHAHGWDPNGATTALVVSDSDIDIQNAADLDKTFVSILVYASGQTVCGVNFITDGFFTVNCSQGIFDGAELHYVITKLPSHLVTSTSLSASSSESSSTHSSQYESLRSLDEIASEFP
jgi:hypothetical protein